MRMSMSFVFDGVQQPLPPAMPAISMRINLHVVSVSANGDMSVEFDYSNATVADAPGVPDAMISALRASTAAINGARGRMIMTPRGAAREMSLEMPPAANPALKQQLDGFADSLTESAPLLPEEPVGVGARWRTERQVTLQGTPVKYVATFTLSEMNADVRSITADVAYAASDHDLKLEGLPGAQARISSLTGKGSGQYTIGSRDAMPRRADMSVASDMSITITGPGQSQKMQQSMVMKVVISEPPSR